MRAFVALELPAALRDKVAAVAQALHTPEARVRWVEPTRMHLTLKFLGDIDEEQAASMTRVLYQACEGMGPMRLGIGGLGAFPNRRSPRVLWVGVEQSGVLEALHGKLEEGAARLGIPRDERDFRPHLTLGRVKYVPKHSALLRRLKSIEVETAYATADRISLFESTLSPEGPSYRTLATARLLG